MSALTRPVPSSRSLPVTSSSSAFALTPLATSLTPMRLLLASALPLPSMLPPQALPDRRVMRSNPLSSPASSRASATSYWRNFSCPALRLKRPLRAVSPSSATGVSAGAAGVACRCRRTRALRQQHLVQVEAVEARRRLHRGHVAAESGAAVAFEAVGVERALQGPLHARASTPALPPSASASGCRPGSARLARSSSVRTWPRCGPGAAAGWPSTGRRSCAARSLRRA